MESKNFIFKEGGKYYVTPIGKIIVRKLKQLVNTLHAIEKNEKFIINHDLSPIPEELLNRIDELEECIIVESSMENVIAPFIEVRNSFSKAISIMYISSIFDPSYVQLFLYLAQRNIHISIILTDQIWNRIMEDYKNEMELYLINPNIKLFLIKDNVNIAFAVTDKSMVISLNYVNGYFDITACMIGFDKMAIEWGKDLFKYYQYRSDEIK